MARLCHGPVLGTTVARLCHGPIPGAVVARLCRSPVLQRSRTRSRAPGCLSGLLGGHLPRKATCGAGRDGRTRHPATGRRHEHGTRYQGPAGERAGGQQPPGPPPHPLPAGASPSLCAWGGTVGWGDAGGAAPPRPRATGCAGGAAGGAPSWGGGRGSWGAPVAAGVGRGQPPPPDTGTRTSRSQDKDGDTAGGGPAPAPPPHPLAWHTRARVYTRM